MGINNKETIFVPVAACNEYFLEHTVKGALALAEHPDRVFFGIYNNILSKDQTLLDNDFFTNNPNIYYVEVISPEPLGVGFARMSASLLTTMDHDYVFQTDAHSILSKNWDTTFINNFKEISQKENTDKIVLTAMCGDGWHYNKEDRNSLSSLNHDFKNFSVDSFYDNNFALEYGIDNALPSLHFDGYQNGIYLQEMVGVPISHSSDRDINGQYEEINCIIATIMFSKYSLMREVMHDPEDPFHGDQINYAIRLLSRNYKIFAVKQPLVMALGKSVVKDGELVEVDNKYNWRATVSANKGYYDYKNQKSVANYLNIVNEKYFGYWGAPDKESLIKAKKKMGYLNKHYFYFK